VSAFVAFPGSALVAHRGPPPTGCSRVGAFCASYLFLFYNRSPRVDNHGLDIAVGRPASRHAGGYRGDGYGMLITTGLFLLMLCGPYMPDVIQHKGASVSRFVSHFWPTTGRTYRARRLGAVIFLFVLFGTLLDPRARATIRCRSARAARSPRGGRPGFGGLAERHGFGVLGLERGLGRDLHHSADAAHRLFGGEGRRHRGASSINGQLMPPVMGAAAFLMVEYVGILTARSSSTQCRR
jgi:hypothetical protein